MSKITLATYRKKGINAYLAPSINGKADTSKAMYGKPVSEADKEAAHKSKKHMIEIDLSSLSDGKYIYKEAGGADFNKARYGWIEIKNGEIVDED